ncbi:MAG: sigma-70 family RNA polymerase sigma factor [Croceibacterium sp.]
MPVSDDQLRTWMAEGLAGNAASHAALLRAVAPVLRAFYRRRFGHEDAIEDLVQETLIAVHTRRISYDPSRPLSPWLFAIARYKMVDHFRRSRSTVPLEDAEHVASDAETEQDIHARLDIDQLLATLPPKQASLIRAMHLEGHSVADVARSRGIGESAAKVSAHRGIKALALRMRQSGP